MFFITNNDKFWNGKNFIDNYKQATVYYSVASSISELTLLKNRGAKLTPLTDEQFNEFNRARLDI